ncbi:putative Leucine-rich repeat transmembrane protein kinase protein [Quillaja saponaria]|uniref:Leucine-rich repeat transmembrane protein kinase protein n=1 Tax=Quillaja saponaria TaxID=32244 RepID=A0AAD7PBE1_QUISA|nr:putative Leucine-rich repeat transmembrane protein kinase protein [Quillaja saponaria]
MRIMESLRTLIVEHILLITRVRSWIETTRKQVSHIRSLRAFPVTRKKYFYTTETDEATKVLVLESFYYGNYDNKDSPPTFELHLDGNFWVTVNASGPDVVVHDAIYNVKRGAISVCVARIYPNQAPFINALDFGGLKPGKYSHIGQNQALLLVKRANYGRNPTGHDRPFSNIVEDDPPYELFTTAVTPPSNSTTKLSLNIGLPTKQVLIYITTFFSEVLDLKNTTDKRSFQIYIDNKSYSNPIIPLFEGETEEYITDITASSETSFKLVSASNSTLPPLINGMEV